MKVKEIDARNIHDISEDQLDWLKRVVDNELERRNEPEYEEFDLYYVDDGCEGTFFTIDDFEECARDLDTDEEERYDLIDYIVQTLFQGSSISIYPVKQPLESLQGQFFFNKDNPYEDRFDEDGELKK